MKFLLIYVDDIILTGFPNAPFDTLLASLHKEFIVKDLGQLRYFVGIEVHNTNYGLLLTQSKYIHSVLDCVAMLDCKPSSAPIGSGSCLSVLDGDPLPALTIYHQVVSSLQYLTLTRLDITYAIQTCMSVMHWPTTIH